MFFEACVLLLSTLQMGEHLSLHGSIGIFFSLD